jgi:hypothetical protein
VFGMLLEVFRRDPVARQLRIARKLVVFLDDLLGRAAHLALGAGTVEHSVDDIPDRAIAVRLVART